MAVSYTNTTTRITITSTDGVYATLSDISSVIGSKTIFEDLGGGSYLIHRTGGDHKEFYINANCKIIIQSGETLYWEGVTTTSTYNGLYVADNASIYMESGSTIDMNYDGQSDSRYYFYLYGQMIADGAPDGYITIQHYRSLYDYSRQSTYWNYVHLKDNSYNSTGGYMYYFENSTTTTNAGQRIYRNVKVTDINNRGRVYFYYFGTPVPGSLWEDWYIDGINGFICLASTMKFTRFTFKNITDYIQLQGCGHNVGFRYITEKSDEDFTNKYFQPMTVFDNCYFELNDLGVYQVLIRSGSLVYFKNCIFNGTIYGIYGLYGSRILERDNTFIYTSSQRLWGLNSTFFDTYEATIRVIDGSGNPIENAAVSIIQSEGKEVHTGFVDENGYLTNIYGDPTLLVNREQYGNGLYVKWSDSIDDGRFHYIKASAPGYTNYEGKYEITEDKEITIILRPTLYNGDAMGDFKTILKEKITERLSSLGIEIETIVEDDRDTPYIYIGDVQSFGLNNDKEHYNFEGFVNIKYYTGYNITGSLSEHYNNIEDIKGLLKTAVNDVLDLTDDGFDMVSWYLENENDLEILDYEKRIYRTGLQFYFEIEQK